MDLITAGDRRLDTKNSQPEQDTRFAPVLDWTTLTPSEHFVQFYESDPSLVDAVSRFLGAGLMAGENCLVIATPEHQASIEARLEAEGVDLLAAAMQGQYVAMDAALTLSQFMYEGTVDSVRFQETIGSAVTRAAAGGKRVRAFGEMVHLLWSEGNQAAAMRLEEQWNELAHTAVFSLFCAYSMDAFGEHAHAETFAHICRQHSRVIPAESYAALSNPEARLREIALLQQKAKALEAEIDQRKKLERELSDFLENATEPIHKVGPDGTILWANAAELELLGYRSDEYIGHSIVEFHVDRPVIEEMVAKLLRNETLHNYPARLRSRDGSIKHVLVQSNAYFENGKFRYTRCFSRDVTYLRETEIVHRRLAAIVDSSEDAIIGKTLEGIITFWNKGAERIFGYRAEEAVGRSKTMLFPPELVHEEDTILARLRRGEYIEHFESVRRRKDGTQIDVSLTISPIRNHEGVIIGASTIARDITQARQQQHELALLNAHLQRSILEIHHRVKNNLQIIGAMIEMQAFAHRNAGAVPIETFDRLQLHIGALAIVHELLTDCLKISEDMQRISIKQVLNRLLPLLQQHAGKTAIRFDIAEAEILSKQCISLAMSVNELVSNALKRGASHIEVTLKRNEGQAILETNDDGSGFPPNFDPQKPVNTGLELVDNLVGIDLAGQVTYENRQDGGAMARILFRLPVDASRPCA